MWSAPDAWQACVLALFGLPSSTAGGDDLSWMSRLVQDAGILHVRNKLVVPLLTSMLEEGCRVSASNRPTPETAQSRFHDARESGLLQHLFNLLTELHIRSSQLRTLFRAEDFVKALLRMLHVLAFDSVAHEAVTSSEELDQASDLMFSNETDPGYSSEALHKNAHFVALARRLPRLGSASSVITLSDTESAPSRAANQVLKPSESASLKSSNALSDCVLRLLTSIFLDQIFESSNFTGLGLFTRAPRASLSRRVLLLSMVMDETVLAIENEFRRNTSRYDDPKCIVNTCRVLIHLFDAMVEGWYSPLSGSALHLAAVYLTALQDASQCGRKSVLLCHSAMLNVASAYARLCLHLVSSRIVLDADEEMQRNFHALVTQLARLPVASSTSIYLKSLIFGIYSNMSSSDDEQSRRWLSFMSAFIRQHVELLQRWFGLDARSSDRFTVFWSDSSHPDPGGENVVLELPGVVAAFESVIPRDFKNAYEHTTATINETYRASAESRILKRKDRLQQDREQQRQSIRSWSEELTALSRWKDDLMISEIVRQQQAQQAGEDATYHARTLLAQRCQLMREAANLGSSLALVKWELDGVEGPQRTRLRFLQAQTQDVIYRPKRQISVVVDRKVSFIKPNSGMRGATVDNSSDGQTPITTARDESIANADQVEQDDFEIIPENAATEPITEDKNRRVLRSLHAGETVISVYNISVVQGLELCQALLIVGKLCVYFVDDLFQCEDGEIVSSADAPAHQKDAFASVITNQMRSSPGLVQANASLRLAKRSFWIELIAIVQRGFLFRNVGLELVFADGSSYMITTSDTKQRKALFNDLSQFSAHAAKQNNDPALRYTYPFLQQSIPKAPGFRGRLTNALGFQASIPATQDWLQGRISNFEYLMLVNAAAGRTPNDLTNYPVFPWVLGQYSETELDLDDSASFRDLSKPMGCQTPQRERSFRERYNAFSGLGDNATPPFHYGTHYSSAMIVSSYLIRLEPFVKSYLLLQGGHFDHPDRLFSSIGAAWLSASQATMTDVRELIPEFFYLPEFLLNGNNFDFGSKETTGEKIHDVVLPPWAHNDPAVFISKHREALESPYVSRNLHHWIDLVFGHQQRGAAAEAAGNVFHHLSYSGAKDLETIEDQHELESTVGILHSFGQTPQQIFQRPHEAKGLKAKATTFSGISRRMTVEQLPTEGRAGCADIVHVLTHCAEADVIYHIELLANSRPRIAHSWQAYRSGEDGTTVQWDFADNSIRVFRDASAKILEHAHTDQINTAAFMNPTTFITASADGTVGVWTCTTERHEPYLKLRGYLHGHTSSVTHIATSPEWHTLVTASSDGEIRTWDINRLNVIRLFHFEGVLTVRLCQVLAAKTSLTTAQAVHVSPATAHIMICTTTTIALYTLNGRLLTSQDLCNGRSERITACAFHDATGEPWSPDEVILTGHSDGHVKCWSLTCSGRPMFVLAPLLMLPRWRGEEEQRAISCIISGKKRVHAGDERGRLVSLDNADIDRLADTCSFGGVNYRVLYSSRKKFSS
ncbi:hypothetical protein MRB53_037612 [Persea americana]|nr:hypothetical protein MRB53_037612 [Persea americana]